MFVDDYSSRVSHYPFMADLAEKLNEQLLQHDVASMTIEPDRVEQLKAETSSFDQLHINDVGQRLGADIVLHVRVKRFQLRDSGSTTLWRGMLQVTVRMVEAGSPTRLWPQDRPDGCVMDLIRLGPQDNPSRHYASTVSKQLATRAADKIAKLFYDHKIPIEESYRPSGSILDD